MFDILIRGGLIVDGTGKPGEVGDVGIVGDRICAIGDLSQQSAKQEILAKGKVITPGFIDPHSHPPGHTNVRSCLPSRSSRPASDNSSSTAEIKRINQSENADR